jgi:hypothetical protein
MGSPLCWLFPVVGVMMEKAGNVPADASESTSVAGTRLLRCVEYKHSANVGQMAHCHPLGWNCCLLFGSGAPAPP